MLELYHNAMSVCAQKVRVVLAEKRIDYIGHALEIRAGETHTPGYRALNPKGVVPTLVVDGLPIVESTIICEYLDEIQPYPSLRPDAPFDRAAMRQWTIRPDFRLTMHHRNRLMKELARAEADGQTPLIFMHGYPADLAADGEIEEGGGTPGFSIVTVHDRVPSWRFKQTGGDWPFVQIVAPADLRMVTRPADPQQVPRPGAVEIVAKVFGPASAAPLLSVDGGAPEAMTAGDGTSLWRATVSLDAGLHALTVACGTDRDTIQLLVRAASDIPRRGVPIAPGSNVHAIGAWPEHGIEGTQLGPNKNGKHW